MGKKKKIVVINTSLRVPIMMVINLFSVMVSWYFNKSVLWAIFHWVFGLFYLIYSLLIGRFADGGFMEIINYYF